MSKLVNRADDIESLLATWLVQTSQAAVKCWGLMSMGFYLSREIHQLKIKKLLKLLYLNTSKLSVDLYEEMQSGLEQSDHFLRQIFSVSQFNKYYNKKPS